MQSLKELLDIENGFFNQVFEEDAAMRRLLFRTNQLNLLRKEGWEIIPIHQQQLFELAEDLAFVRIYDAKAQLLQQLQVDKVPLDTFELKTAHVQLVMQQMKENGTRYTDDEADFFEGIGRVLEYDKERNRFILTEYDTVVGSFHNVYELSETAIAEKLMELASLFDLRKQGFELPYLP